MRNVAISLLLADSASAQKAADPMAQDKAVPPPILIADAWSSAGCVDTAVTAANTAVTTADAAWKKLVDEKAAKMDKEVATALAAKKTAVDAVIAKDVAIADLLKADDAEQQKELTAKGALDAANYALATATTAATAANTAKTAADSALAAAKTVQTAMDTAKTAADTHLAAEKLEVTTDTNAKSTADTASTNAQNAISNLTTLDTAAKTAYDTKKTDWDAKLLDKEVKNALKTKTAAVLVTATTAIDAGTALSAKAVQVTETATLATKNNTLTAAATAWKDKALLTVAAMKNWLAAEAYTLGNAGQKCASDQQSSIVATAAGDANDAACKTECGKLKAWGMNVGNTFPVQNAATGAGYCYGYQFDTGATKCHVVTHTTVTETAQANFKCYKRTKGTYGGPLWTASELSKSGGTLEAAHAAALTAWLTQSTVLDGAQGKLDIATQYKTKVNTDNTQKASESGTADSAYTTVDGELTAKKAAYTTSTTNLNTGKALVTSTAATATAAAAKLVAQNSEVAYQEKIVAQATKDKTAQDLLVTGLTTAATGANTAKTTADTAKSTATTTKGTKLTAYNALVTSAAATATKLTTPLADLATLRGTATTATAALNTKLGNQTAQVALIATAAATLAGEKAKLLAAVVACKETEFDKYKKTLAAAETARASALATIKALVSKAGPAAGKAGARCEKALSNGTGRPKRGEKTCDTGLCCGAAKVPVGKAMMTIETCQAKDAKTYDYSPPRAPMQTSPSTSASYNFTCIEGAKNVAATASALAAALYMMA